MEQMDGFQSLLQGQGDNLKLILGYGDSTDGTGEALFDECQNRFDALLMDVSNGLHQYGSIVHAERFKQLAIIGNTLWKMVPATTQVVGMVESDLIWKPETLWELLDRLKTHCQFSSVALPKYMVAPLVLHEDDRFYDTWAFRAQGYPFQHKLPYHPVLLDQHIYVEVDSVGSCFLATCGATRFCTWPEEDVVVGFCNQFRELGGRIFVEKDLKVYHP